MFKEDHLSFRQRKYMKVKNIIGRALGGIGLVVLSPVYLAIIVAIKKEDGITAPVFFSQKRVGIHKEYFNLYKFRSMRTDTPHDKPTHLLENPDQYITKVGSRLSSKGQKNKNNFNKHPLGVYFLPFFEILCPYYGYREVSQFMI